LLVRYTKNNSGKPVRQAVIFTREEHNIRPEDIDPDVIKIANRLQSAGHVAYIVGGAVRDLLLGKTPKDFDIATDAQPNRIRRLFRNSRVIGKRFRLVHVFYPGDKIIEVATFRAEHSSGFENHFGEIEEDVYRRDFTMNALYYCPLEQKIIDYVGGVSDIRERKLKAIIPLDHIFAEDPVRMIRAIKYQTSTGCKVVWRLRRQLKRDADQLDGISPSRMTEEVFKILLSGYSAGVLSECRTYGLLKHMLPSVAGLVESRAGFWDALNSRLECLDREVTEGGEDRRSRAIAYLSADYLYAFSEAGKQQRIPFADGFAELKNLIKPLVPANKDVEMALVYLIRRRKNYSKNGMLEITPPSERVRTEDERYRHETDPDSAPKPAKKRGRRRRRPSSSRKPQSAGE